MGARAPPPTAAMASAPPWLPLASSPSLSQSASNPMGQRSERRDPQGAGDEAPCAAGGEIHREQPAGGEPHRGQPRLGITEVRREQVAGGELDTAPMQSSPPKSKKKSKNKGGVATASISASPRVGSPVIVARSPGINMMVRAAALKRASLAVRSASEKRAKLADSLERSPSVQTFPSLESPQRSSSLQTLSPAPRTTSSRGPKRRPRKLTSEIWKEVEPIYLHGKLVEGRCCHCHQIFPASRDLGTSHIGRHLKVCEMRTKVHDMVDKIRSSVAIDPNWKFDADVSRRKLIRMIILQEMPFTIVEHDGFRSFVASLNPWFKMVSRITIQSDCIIAYKEHRLVLQDFFKKCDTRISLTADMWTSNQKLGYLCIKCHFIDIDWNVQKMIIRFCMMETPHDALNMYNVVLKSIQNWNIEDKLFSFTLDNASVNTAMVNLLSGNLVQKGLLHLKGKLLHMRCASHIFNIIVQDGLKEMKSVIDNIRESVKYVKSSQSRGQKFDEIIAQVGVTCRKHPSLDVTTRWNSTFLMLESALPFRGVFHALGQQDTNYKYAPLPHEWTMAEAVCKLLRVFYNATQVVSGSTYPTSNRYFHEVWNVKQILSKEASSENSTIASMVNEMQNFFDKYWKESYLAICIPVVLDPRFKYDLLEFCLEEFGDGAENYLHKVKKAIQQLFDEYAQEVDHSVPREGDADFLVEEDEDDPLANWDQHMRYKRSQVSNELDRYLKEELFPRRKAFDILKWWQIHSSKYPVLSCMARDILAIPASTVASESAFSTGGRVISDYRSSLSCDTIEALICLQDWLRTAGSSQQNT